MRSAWAKICSLIIAIGLLSLGPSCTCDVSASEHPERPEVSSISGTSATNADDECCSDRKDEHQERNSDECCGCDGHSTEAPRSFADLGVGVAAGTDRLLLETTLASSGMAGVPAPWTLDIHRRDGPSSAAPIPSDSSRTTTSSAPRYLTLQVLRL